MIGRDGREVLLTPSRSSRGGFLIEGLPRPGEFSLPAGLRLRLESAGKTIDAIVPRDGSNHLWVQDPAKPAAWQKIGLPVALAAEPIAWGGGVLFPGLDARAYLIDPLTGRSSAEPFVPKFDRDHQGTWLPPAVVDRETVVLADDVGQIHRVALKTAPVPRLVGEATDDASTADHRRPGLDRRRGDRGDGRPARPGAGRPRLEPGRVLGARAPLAGAAGSGRRRLLRHGSSRRSHGLGRDGKRPGRSS